MTRELSQHALIHRSLSFVAAFALVAMGAGLAPDEVEAIETIEDPYVTGGAAPIPAQEEPVEPGTLIQYSPSELEDMVARIALYPDDLIAIVLPASTFPLQVVEAQRFLERSKEGGSTTPDPEWDQSVVALLNYPDVVSLMNEDLEWMSRLGDAVVNQQQDVLGAVSRFRDRAYAAGNLRSDDRQVVSRPEEVIEIAPADPEVIYVPYYEPARVVVYEPAPVFYYYPRPCPVYYYSYPPDYFYAGYRPFWPLHFWGVSFVFNIGWHEHHLHVHDHGHWRPPYFGHHYYAWDRHDRRHWRDDRRWHHDDDRHDGWHDHEGDDWRDRDGDDDRGNHQQFAGSGRKGQGKSIAAKDGIELAAAADTGKGRTTAARPAGSAKPATPTKSGKPVSAAKPRSPSQPAKQVATGKPAAPGKPGAAKPVSPAKPATTKGSSGTQLADSTSHGQSGDAAERAASANGQDKRSSVRPPTQKPVHGTTQLASNETVFAPRSSSADRADTRPKPVTPPPRTTAQSQRPAPAPQYVNGFASQPQARSSTSAQRSAPATQYMNGFASQPRSTQTWSTSSTSSREYTTQRSDSREPAATSSRSAEAPRYSPPPQPSRSQQASRSAPPPPQASRPAPQTSRSAPPPKSAPAQSSKGDSGGSGERSSGSSKSSHGGGQDGKASRD